MNDDQLNFLDVLESTPPLVTEPDIWSVEEIFNNLSESSLLAFPEDFRVERKSARVQKKDLALEACAFANAIQYGGCLIIGIEDNGEITGFEEVGLEKASELEGRFDICPDVQFDHRRFEVTNSRGNRDFVLLMYIHPRKDKLVETSKGEAFIREGKNKRKLSETEKREIRIARGQVDYEREPVSLKYPDDFDQSLIELFYKNYIRKRGLNNGSKEEIMHWAKLGKLLDGSFTPNLACAIVFANDPRDVCPGARIRFQRFSGTEEGSGANYNLVRDEFIEGPLPRLIEQAEQVVSSQMRNFTRLGKDGRFYTRPEYPRDAWIEAIVNACVHRSYNFRSMNIFVKMFDDKFVVESPGGFHPPTTAANIYESHNPRNPHLMEALFYFDMVKCAHEGTIRMKNEMEAVDLPPPIFSEAQGNTTTVHVTLRNNVAARKSFMDESAAELLGRSVFATLRPNERMIVNYLAEHGKANVTEIHRLVQCDWRTAKATLTRLVERDILEHISFRERDSKAFYRLKEPH